MSLSRRLTAAVATGAAFASLALAGDAAAAFPDFSDCPRATSNVCIDVASVERGALKVNRTSIPLAAGSLELRGGVDLYTSIEPTYRAPLSTPPLTAVGNSVPGGLLGIDLPIPGNTVTATFELAGTPADISFDPFTLALKLPVKIRLANRYLSANCHIGSDAAPIALDLHADPLGSDSYDPATDVLTYTGTVEVGGDFAVPGATGCGYYPRGTLVNTLVNKRLGLPSAAGQNAISLPVTVAIGAAA
jgi:hypothetical protein